MEGDLCYKVAQVFGPSPCRLSWFYFGVVWWPGFVGVQVGYGMDVEAPLRPGI